MKSKNKTTNGDLKVPVIFYDTETDDSLDGVETKKDVLFMTFAEVYNPSIKDVDLARERNVKAQYTIKFRDPQNAYIPKNHHLVEINDNRLPKKLLGVVDIRPDFVKRDFIVMVLGG